MTSGLSSMYRTCLHCHAALGRNEVIEHFPVGRRLAFDGEKGRLWVVCEKCRRWNLTPLEERWEAIEECEREFSRTRLRVSSDNIALARVPAGLDLVRVGSPQRPELAAWRYGKSLHRRWKTRAVPFAALGTSGWVVQLLTEANLIAFGPAMGILAVAAVPSFLYMWRKSRVRAMLPDGRVITITHQKPQAFELEPDGEYGWAIRLAKGADSGRVTGTSATHTLRGVLTATNFFGGRQSEIDGAVTLLQDSGDPARFVRKVAAMRGIAGTNNICDLPPEVQLGLEMALHEEAERRALEGELQALREEWRLAEEIARIADDMFLPANVIAGLQRLRRGVPEGGQ